MTVIVLTLCKKSLRGYLTQWLMEIDSGVFVGKISSRVRERLWEKIVDLSIEGRALMVYQSPGEQGMSVRTHQHHWKPVDIEGVTLMERPHGTSPGSGRKKGWSNAAKYRKYGKGRQPQRPEL